MADNNGVGGRPGRRGTGARYEEEAAEYLRSCGYKILERNFFSRYGEIDLIAEDGGVIVYCEVKYRRNGRYGDALEAVDCRKQEKIGRTALYHRFLRGFPEDKSCRFDVIGIYGDGKITHIKNAFEFRS